MHGQRSSLTAGIGERLRRSRLAVPRSRGSYADVIGVSEWTIGRMERGQGDGIAVRRWAALADALGLRLRLALEPGSAPDPRGAPVPGSAPVPGIAPEPEPRVLTAALLQRLGRAGDWTLTAQDERIAVLDRPSRCERLVVYLCDRPIEILDAADDCMAARDDPTRVPPPGWRTASMTVVRAELRDRYRPMDQLADDLSRFHTTGTQTIVALRNPRIRLPDVDVLVWCDEHATRLIPFGLDLEPGRRAYRRRPERRRPAARVARRATPAA